MVKWSRSVVSDSLRPHGLLPTWLLCPWDFPGNSTGVDCHFLLQRIFPTQGSNPGLPHCRQTLYCLSHQRSPIMVQHAKYYSERINFTKTNAWEMMEESKQVLQMTMYLSPNLLLKQVPEEMSPWLTAQCNGDLPKKTEKKVTCCWLSHSAWGFNSSTKKTISEEDTSTCASWESWDESGPQLPSPPDSSYLSPLQCKGLESRHCPHLAHQHTPRTKITWHTVASLLVEWQMNFTEGCGGIHCGNRRKKQAKNLLHY